MPATPTPIFALPGPDEGDAYDIEAAVLPLRDRLEAVLVEELRRFDVTRAGSGTADASTSALADAPTPTIVVPSSVTGQGTHLTLEYEGLATVTNHGGGNYLAMQFHRNGAMHGKEGHFRPGADVMQGAVRFSYTVPIASAAGTWKVRYSNNGVAGGPVTLINSVGQVGTPAYRPTFRAYVRTLS